MSEKRLETLETLVAYQDDTLRSLNDTLYAQQQRIDGLEHEINKLKQRLEAEMQPGGQTEQHELPPHY